MSRNSVEKQLRSNSRCRSKLLSPGSMEYRIQDQQKAGEKADKD